MEEGEIEKAVEVISQAQEVIVKDGNMGLVNKLMKSTVENKIKGMSRTFLTLSKDEILANLGKDSKQEELDHELFRLID